MSPRKSPAVVFDGKHLREFLAQELGGESVGVGEIFSPNATVIAGAKRISDMELVGLVREYFNGSGVILEISHFMVGNAVIEGKTIAITTTNKTHLSEGQILVTMEIVKI